MTSKELVDKIFDWEAEAGESFYDYYAHDRIEYLSWADFLELKGYKERADEIRQEYHKDSMNYVDQETLFHIYSESGELWRKNTEKNLNLLAEYLCSNEQRLAKVLKWFEQEEY